MDNEINNQIPIQNQQPIQPAAPSIQSIPIPAGNEELPDASKNLSRILIYGRVVSVVNILQVIYFGFMIVRVIPFLPMISMISSCMSGSEQDIVNEICYTMGPSLIFMLPSFIFSIIEIILLCYATVLGFSLKHYDGDYKKFKKYLIIFAVISTLSPLGVFALVGDIIVFAFLLPKYKRELENRTSPTITTQNTI